MTAPTPPTTPPSIQLLQEILAELKALREDVKAIQINAPGKPAPILFSIEYITKSTDQMENTNYFGFGPPYRKFGVRIWPEVLPLIGTSEDALKPGKNPFPARVVAEPNAKGNPHKIIGLAPDVEPSPLADYFQP